MGSAVPLNADPHPTTASHRNLSRFLYPAVASLLTALVFMGFQDFYLHGRAYPGRELAEAIKWLLITHGLLMTAWMLLFLAQTLLITSGRRRVHMWLGSIGTFLAASVLVSGMIVPIAVARIDADTIIWGMHWRQFMAVPLFGILTFGVFVMVGIWNRRRSHIHRPMMLLATLSTMGAATDRIESVVDLYAATIWGSFFGPGFIALSIGILFLALKAVIQRELDRALASGLTFLALSYAAAMQTATSAGWEQIATLLLGS
jgi:hypothetical protein